MSSSGLIYAVIVGAWAAYLVPMWLRRQDELNEARPTERFSTAIRLLSGKAAMERRYAKGTERREEEAPEDGADSAAPLGGTVADGDDARESAPDTAQHAVDVRALADPRTMAGGHGAAVSAEMPVGSERDRGTDSEGGQPAPAEQNPPDRNTADRTAADRSKARENSKARESSKRARVLARRRRTTMLLFLAFTLGTLVAAVGGLAFLWAPVFPGLLLSAYIVHLRVQERRRFAVTMDRRQAEAAAQRLRERRTRLTVTRGQETGSGSGSGVGREHAQEAPEARPQAQEEAGAADRRALVEQTDHAEWVDQQRRGDREGSEGWEPVPVPLPTYVSAPVAPRTARGVDVEAPGTWSSARSRSASGEASPPAQPSADEPAPAPRRRRSRGRTPLFDQYEDGDRPCAANE